MPHAQRASAGRLTLCGLLLVLLTLLGGTAARADDSTAEPDPSASSGTRDGGDEDDGAEEDEDPVEAGTDFRTATVLRQEQHGTADAATGDYLYWVFPAAAGDAPRVRATIELPRPRSRTGPVTWQLDVYDGLRRRQACTAGTPTKTAATQTERLTLSCRIRAVQPWADTWANDPLSGAFYVRLAALSFPAKDLGLPVHTEVETASEPASGARRGGGKLGAPLVPSVRAGTADAADSRAPEAESDDAEDTEDGEDAGQAAQESSEEAAEPDDDAHLALVEPDDGWTGSWWSDRWAWTGGGAVLAALTGIGGYRLTRRR